jgi:hypothetical protein
MEVQKMYMIHVPLNQYGYSRSARLAPIQTVHDHHWASLQTRQVIYLPPESHNAMLGIRSMAREEWVATGIGI